jgi:hypothetical protein
MVQVLYELVESATRWICGNSIRIGTRESDLALWQAQQVWNYFQKMGQPAGLVPIKSQGDMDLHTPLYEMGIQLPSPWTALCPEFELIWPSNR